MTHFTKSVGQTIAMALAFALLIAQLADAHPFKSRYTAGYDRFEQEEDVFAAPALSGPEQVYDSTRFRIHYTLLGQDAVPKADDNLNGTPDYVEQVVAVLEGVHRVEVEQFGWLAPPADKGFGGNDLYDVYLLEMLGEGLAGFVDGGFEETWVGDNPNSPNAVETRASFSLMGLDNDYAGANEFEQGITPEALLRTTVAHEYTHALQMGYDGEEPLEWIWEASATWMQDEVFDDVNDANSIIADMVESPSTCQAAADPYAMWVFLRYISERFGSDTVRAIWENAVALDGYATVETALAQAGGNLDGVIADFAVAILTRDFKEGADYPTVRLEASVNENSFSPEAGVAQVGYDFLALEQRGVTTVRLDAANLAGRLIGISGGQAQVFALNDGQATIDMDAFERVYLTVINAQRAESAKACAGDRYHVSFRAGGQADAPVQRVSAVNFAAPQVGELDRGGFDEFDAVDAPEDLIPQDLPPGFELLDVFEDEVDGERFVVLAFENEVGDFIEISATDTDFDSLDEWLDAVDFDPFGEQRFKVNGVDVMLEDLSEPGDPFFLATFIDGGRRIEVSSNLGEGILLDVLESLLEDTLEPNLFKVISRKGYGRSSQAL